MKNNDTTEDAINAAYGVITSHYWSPRLGQGFCGGCNEDIDTDGSMTMAEHRARKLHEAGLLTVQDADRSEDDEREAALDSERLRQLAEWLAMDLGHEETAKRVNSIADRLDRLAAGFSRSEVPAGAA